MDKDRYRDLTNRLQGFRNSGRWRSLLSNPDSFLLDLSHNDYLNLREHSGLKEKIIQTVLDENIPLGSGGSRLLGGNFPLFEKLENKLAEEFSEASALFFSSGFMANLALLSTIPLRHDCIVADEMIHASLRTGIQLSGAKFRKYRHLDLSHARELIKKSSGQVYLVTESIFSMSGKGNTPAELAELVKETGVRLVLDEAHTTGLYHFGNQGFGAIKELQNLCFARIICFGKAFGASGAAVLAHESVTQLLVNAARSFIFTTAPSPMLAVQILQTLDFLQQNRELEKRLLQNIRDFSDLVSGNSETHLHPVFYFANPDAEHLSKQLLEAGFLTRPIRPPTVPTEKTGIRISLHQALNHEALKKLSQYFTQT